MGSFGDALALKPDKVAPDGRLGGAQNLAQGSAAYDLLALKVLVNELAALRGDQVFAQIRPLSFSQKNLIVIDRFKAPGGPQSVGLVRFD
jgi:hypothetical protein